MAQDGDMGPGPFTCCGEGAPTPLLPQIHPASTRAGSDLSPQQTLPAPGSLFLPTILCPSYSWKNLSLDMDLFLGGQQFP